MCRHRAASVLIYTYSHRSPVVIRGGIECHWGILVEMMCFTVTGSNNVMASSSNGSDCRSYGAGRVSAMGGELIYTAVEVPLLCHCLAAPLNHPQINSDYHPFWIFNSRGCQKPPEYSSDIDARRTTRLMLLQTVRILPWLQEIMVWYFLLSPAVVSAIFWEWCWQLLSIELIQ